MYLRTVLKMETASWSRTSGAVGHCELRYFPKRLESSQKSGFRRFLQIQFTDCQVGCVLICTIQFHLQITQCRHHQYSLVLLQSYTYLQIIIIFFLLSCKSLQSDNVCLKKKDNNKSSKYMKLIGYNLDTDIKQHRILINTACIYKV